MTEAIVAVIRRGGRVLVVQRAPGTLMAGHWSPPSGRIEPGESQAEAVVREMREELGITVTPVAKVWECPTDDGQFRLHWWTVSEPGAELVLLPAEVSAVRWVDAGEFLAMTGTFEGDRTFFREILPRLV